MGSLRSKCWVFLIENFGHLREQTLGRVTLFLFIKCIDIAYDPLNNQSICCIVLSNPITELKPLKQ